MLRRYFLFMQDAIWVHLLLKKAIFMRLLFTRHSKTVAIPPRKRVLCIVALNTLPRKVPGENRQFAISGGFFWCELVRKHLPTYKKAYEMVAICKPIFGYSSSISIGMTEISLSLTRSNKY